MRAGGQVQGTRGKMGSHLAVNVEEPEAGPAYPGGDDAGVPAEGARGSEHLVRQSRLLVLPHQYHLLRMAIAKSDLSSIFYFPPCAQMLPECARKHSLQCSILVGKLLFQIVR